MKNAIIIAMIIEIFLIGALELISIFVPEDYYPLISHLMVLLSGSLITLVFLL